MTIGIYKLNFIGTDKVYIGQSVNIESRFKEHLYKLKADKHFNYKISDTFKIFGTPNYEILKTCSIQELNIYEIQYIKKFNSCNNGLNILEGDIRYINNIGENHPNSKYSNEKIIEVFKLLIDLKYIPLKEISNITGVTLYTIQNISCLKSHSWLQEMFPNEYKQLQKLKGKRNSSSAKGRGIKYPKLLSPSGEIFSNIEHLTKFAIEHSLAPTRLCMLFNGKSKMHRGWKLAKEYVL